MTDEQRVELAARLTAHEFMIEVILAIGFSQTEPAAAAAVVGGIRRAARQSYTSGDDDPDDLAVAARSGEMIGRLLDKVVERADSIRRGGSRTLG